MIQHNITSIYFLTNSLALFSKVEFSRPVGPEGHLTDSLYLHVYFSSLRQPYSLNNTSRAINTSNFNGGFMKRLLFIHSVFIHSGTVLSDEVPRFR